MPNLMQRGATWLGARLQDAAGRTVTYRQGRTTVASLVGWVAEHREQVDGEVLPLTIEDYRWSFVASELGITPRAGDSITETLDGRQVVYEVLPMSDSEPAYENADSSGLLILVHTKRICDA